MERGGSLRLILLGIAGVFIFMALNKFQGGGGGESQPFGKESRLVAAERGPNAKCDLWTPEFHAELRSRGATLSRFQLLTAKYRKDGKPLDLTTTPDPGADHEFRQQLFARFRGEGPEDPATPWNVDYDSVDYALTRSDGKSCEFHYQDQKVSLTKVVSITSRPYELDVKTTIKNLGERPYRHAVSFDTVAWRHTHEVEGKMFRISPFVTHVECMQEAEQKAVRLLPDAFEPKAFQEPAFARTVLNPQGDWHVVAGKPAFAAVTNAYFADALAPVSGPAAPGCLLQIDQRPSHDDSAGAMYRARLAYPPKLLGPGEAADYQVLSYIGPKERDILASAGSGKHHLLELIDLGFFSIIAKVLVGFLLKVHSVIPNWGLAIIILTVTARVLLFPLSLPGIKNMIRMREIKPEMDALTEKYKDDPSARGLAQMELWRKHKVNPFKGCLPQLASMPVWFALYTTLQTAVELYNIPFLWFPDLSQSDPLFILPLIIGATYFVQQKIMPQQGGDPMQQKMMMYMMPGMFTVFMLFLPAGLGIYMFTNSLLAITQQLAVEKFSKRSAPGSGGAITVTVKSEGPSGSKKELAAARKGTKKDSKRDEASAGAGSRPLLDEGDHEA
jgi:YidC/Oxa1 family membrane protein insertase